MLLFRLQFAAALPRADSENGSGEDRFAVSEPEANGVLRAAVSDGASDSFLSEMWAELLVETYCRASETPGDVLPSLDAARKAWQQAAHRDPLPWYAEAKRLRGSAATLFGITLYPGGKWEAVAAGDSCLFVVRANRKIVAFPYERAEDMDSMPLLLRTHGSTSTNATLPTCHGNAEEGDDIFLMTDALAAWFLHEEAQGREPWRWLTDIAGTEQPLTSFKERISELRKARRLRDDDVTLLHFRAVDFAETPNAEPLAHAN
jgi:hypothetical protein